MVEEANPSTTLTCQPTVSPAGLLCAMGVVPLYLLPQATKYPGLPLFFSKKTSAGSNLKTGIVQTTDYRVTIYHCAVWGTQPKNSAGSFKTEPAM